MSKNLTIIQEAVSNNNLFPSPLYKMTLFNKIRWRKQSEYGYRVYRFLKDGSDIGYCGISDGGIEDYPHAQSGDIIIGPYYISEDNRGHNYAATMIDMILRDHELSHIKAWIHIATDNFASINVAKRLGFDISFSAIMNDKHQLEKCDGDGEYYVFCK
jgi:RimJ/RimL family protein N-acetyltransferase